MASLLSVARPLLAGGGETDEYRRWRLELVRDRLRIGFWLSIVANPTYVALDFLLYPANGIQFLVARAFLELAMVVGLLLTYTRATEPRQLVQFLLIVWGISFPVAYMTTAIGGFRSTYYAGITLIIFASAVLVPVRWRMHLLAQVGALAFYYTINTLAAGRPPDDIRPAVETSYFLVWTCVVSLVSVFLHERALRNDFSTRSQLESSNRKLLELDRLKTQFFANISHELRTPLTLIIGAFRSLLNDGAVTNSRMIVRAGLRNAVNLLYLINELLDLSRFEGGRMQADPQPVDLASIARQISANFEHSVQQRIHLRGLSEVLVVEGEPRLLKKMIYNLLSNAIKFSEPESGEVWVRMRATQDAVFLEVEDNGIGIAKEDLTRVFDRFTQVEGSANRRYEGSGIGLALVKEIVNLHRGSIEVDSRVGEGSTFTVRFPRCFEPPAEAGAEETDLLPFFDGGPRTEEGLSATPLHSGGLILVADDNRDMREYLQQVLTPHFRVLLASNGNEAIELCNIHVPDLILADIMMPHASGYDLLKSVRSNKALKDVPVVFLSALSASESRVAALETGVDDIVTKPFDDAELVVRLKNILASRRHQRDMVRARLEALRRFLPGPVADALIEHGSDDILKSHRAEITAVFFDLRGFTAFSEEAQPEELMEMLSDYQSRIGVLVDQYHGTLERFSGDAIMVFFNDPIPVPDHPERAIRMAVAARDALPDFEERWKGRGFRLGVGIGASVGYATIGMVGYERRTDYAAIGPVTNLAARLCERAESGQILVPQRLATLLGTVANLVDVGDVRLAGIRTPVHVCNVVGIRSEGPRKDRDTS